MKKIVYLVPAAAAAALLIAGCGIATPTVTTTGSTGSAPASAPSSAAPAAQAATVGSTITLTGNSSGEKVAVTVVQVFPAATGADQFTSPDAGKVFYAVQVRLANTGTAAYSDSPGNGAKLNDASGQSFSEDLSDVSQCVSFPGVENIAPGSSGLGCIVFQAPAGDKITAFQFGLDSGFASQTGQWSLS